MITSNDKTKDIIEKTIHKMVGFMGIDSRIDFKEEAEDNKGKTLVASIYIDNDARFLIGKNGQNLRAFESLLRSVFNKHTDKENSEFKNIAIDINNYRKLKADVLTDIAKQAVARVRNTQKAESLSPMSAYERRIVHMELASYPDIITESIGAEPQRRIVIKPFR